MLTTQKAHPDLDVPKTLNRIQRALQAELKPLGFAKHGRTHHRFVDGDISQVINFQCGQSIYGRSHLVEVNVAIRVPEVVLGGFHGDAELKKYYKEYECNLRTCIGILDEAADVFSAYTEHERRVYDLSGNVDELIEDLLHRVRTEVLPFFERYGSRDAILKDLREQPKSPLRTSGVEYFGDFDMAMIYGRQGDMERAYEAYNVYFRGAIRRCIRFDDGARTHTKNWAKRHIENAEQLGVPITEENMALAIDFIEGRIK